MAGGQERSGDARPASKQGERLGRCDRADGNLPDWKRTKAKLCRKDQDETKVTPILIQTRPNKVNRERVEREVF